MTTSLLTLQSNKPLSELGQIIILLYPMLLCVYLSSLVRRHLNACFSQASLIGLDGVGRPSFDLDLLTASYGRAKAPALGSLCERHA
jgi:hypothetical protein